MSKTIFITGTSSGIGKATAKLFASKGWKVIATMRRPENDTELGQLENVTLLPLDVNNAKQIEETVRLVTQNYEVDVVFNNAGYSLMGPLEGISDEQMIQQMETNFFGVVRVTRAFIPYFRKKKSGLFITTGSIAGLVAFPLGSMYDASKFAIEGWSESLSYELAPFEIGIKIIEPGLVASDLFEKSPTATHPGYEEISNAMAKSFDIESATKPADIAEVVYTAVTDGTKQLRYICGEDAKQFYAQRLEVGDENFIKGMQKIMDDAKNG